MASDYLDRSMRASFLTRHLNSWHASLCIVRNTLCCILMVDASYDFFSYVLMVNSQHNTDKSICKTILN